MVYRSTPPTHLVNHRGPTYVVLRRPVVLSSCRPPSPSLHHHVGRSVVRSLVVSSFYLFLSLSVPKSLPCRPFQPPRCPVRVGGGTCNVEGGPALAAETRTRTRTPRPDHRITMEIVKQQTQEIKKLCKDPYDLAFQVFNLVMIVFSALMIWRGLEVYTKSESPVVVVLSGSMEPAFQRGDILFLNNDDAPIRAGEVVVFKIEGRDIPIVHRILNVHEDRDGVAKYLTKGDNNNIDDRGLYRPGQRWLKRSDIMGRARGHLPFVGMVTILLNDYPMAKYVLVSVMGLFVLTSKE